MRCAAAHLPPPGAIQEIAEPGQGGRPTIRRGIASLAVPYCAAAVKSTVETPSGRTVTLWVRSTTLPFSVQRAFTS